MKHVAVAEVEPAATTSPAKYIKLLSFALETEGVAINLFKLAPTEQLSYALHRHHEQEEVFYVEQGVMTFETPDEMITVTAGELIRFAPGELQLGHNNGDERARVLAIGAPRESTALEYRQYCPICEEDTRQFQSVRPVKRASLSDVTAAD